MIPQSSHPLLCWQRCKPLAFSQWASWCSHLKWFSLHRCAFRGFICGISCLLNGVWTISCVVSMVHSWQPYLTTVRIHIMARTNRRSKEKRQAIITLRTEGQSVRKITKTLMCPQVQSQKPSSATMKLAHMRTASWKEDQESPLRLRISSSKSPASEIAS